MGHFAPRPRAALILGPLAFWAALLGPTAPAAAGCDCSRRVGLCQAQASYDGERIAFTTFTAQCSRVSFSIADHSAAITIQSGAGSVRFAAPGAARDAAVSIDACYVCDVAETR